MYYHIFSSKNVYDYISVLVDKCSVTITTITYLQIFYDLETLFHFYVNMPKGTRSSISDSPTSKLLKEKSKMCTTVISRDLSKKKILMASNLDLINGSLLSKLTFIANYIKNGELLYSGIVILPVMGSTRIFSHQGNFGVAVNQRNYWEESTLSSLSKFLYSIVWKQQSSCMVLLEKIGENAKNYQEMVYMVNNEKLSSPCYLSYIGISNEKRSEGCVVERDRESIHNRYCLDDKTWFLVQTNYDRDTPDPKDD